MAKNSPEPLPNIDSSIKTPWENNENVILLACTIRLLRNIEKYQFVSKLDTERKRQLLTLLLKALPKEKFLRNPKILKSEDITPLEKEFLMEHYLIFEGFQEAFQGAAFIVDSTGQLLVQFNVKDHISLQYTDYSFELEHSLEFLIQLENWLSQSLRFAFLPKFGFLTQDPLVCGTATIISTYLHVPALIHLDKLTTFLEKEGSDSIYSTGLQGNPNELIGDILVIRNSYTLGTNEETIVSTIRNFTLKMILAEKFARTEITESKLPLIQDKISRALGTLKFSYQLETIESLAAISLLKLGVELGCIKGISIRDVNSLFFDVRRAHLLYKIGKTIAHEEIATKRAGFLREKVAAVEVDFSHLKGSAS